ncbi:transporter [Fontibacter flavus]|uniref:Transporter n=1 Tax=Fontibacter flavus TaxID=654838 RepID=A0ABV6FV33_9BACT
MGKISSTYDSSGSVEDAMKVVTALLLTLFLAAIPNFTAYSQACCSGGVPVGGTLGLGTADARSIQILTTYDNNIIHDLMDRRTLLEDETRERQTRSIITEINYGISDNWAVTAFIPYVRQERRILGFQGASEFTKAEGLGDIILLLKYRVLNPEEYPEWHWVLGGGPKIPTGRSDLKNPNGLTMVADMQPGSGSLDGFLWTYLQKSKIFNDPNLSVLSVVTFRKSGANNSYNEVQRYQFGDDFQFNLGLNYNLFIQWPIDIFLFTRYRSQTVDLIDANVFPGSGGKWIYAIPGFNLNLNPNTAIRAAVELPIYRDLLGTQLTTTYRYTLSLFVNIPFKNMSDVLPINL